MNLVADDIRMGSFESQAALRTEAASPRLTGKPSNSEIRLEEERIRQLRQVLRAVVYPGSSVREVLGPEIGRAHLRVDLPLYLRRLRAPTKLNMLVKLFALGVRVSEAEARAALAPFALEDASALGLVECGPRGVRPRIGISVCDNLFLIQRRSAGDQFQNRRGDDCPTTARPGAINSGAVNKSGVIHRAAEWRRLAGAPSFGETRRGRGAREKESYGRKPSTDRSAHALAPRIGRPSRRFRLRGDR